MSGVEIHPQNYYHIPIPSSLERDAGLHLNAFEQAIIGNPRLDLSIIQDSH